MPEATSPPRKGKATENKLATAKKRAEAIEYRIAGATYQQIADLVGYKSRGAAHKAVNIEIAKIPRDGAKELLQIELQRLDFAQVAIWKDIRSGDTFAIDRLIKIMDHRAKLTGLYQAHTDDNSEDVKKALLDFAGGLKDILGGDDGYGSEFIPTDDNSSEAHSEPGDQPG